MRKVLPVGGGLLLALTLTSCGSPEGVGETATALLQKEAVVREAPAQPVREAAVIERDLEGAPERLVVESLGIDSPVLPVKAPGGVLTPPSDPDIMGWWAKGAKPGAARGSVLITGHTVSSGPAPLNDLESIREGSVIEVVNEKATVKYRVDRVRIFDKGFVAEEAERLFSQSAEARLVLITCEDWDGVKYNSNVVVVAGQV